MRSCTSTATSTRSGRRRIREKAPEAVRPFFDLAKAAIKPYTDAGKVQMHKDGTTFAPGITAVAAPGHTVGHTMVRISSSGNDLLIWGDIVHMALQFPEPDRSTAFDNDPAMAIASRRKVFDMVASDRVVFAGAHLPFPGLAARPKPPVRLHICTVATRRGALGRDGPVAINGHRFGLRRPSAWASTPSGIIRLGVLAVLRLITSTNVVGWIIGKSAGPN